MGPYKWSLRKWVLISGPINQFMSWNIWVPLSRLSYCVYLLHMMVIFFIFGLSQGPVIYSSFSSMMTTYVIPGLFFCFLISAFWSAAFEISFSKLEIQLIKMLTNRPKIEKKKNMNLHLTKKKNKMLHRI